MRLKSILIFCMIGTLLLAACNNESNESSTSTTKKPKSTTTTIKLSPEQIANAASFAKVGCRSLYYRQLEGDSAQSEATAVGDIASSFQQAAIDPQFAKLGRLSAGYEADPKAEAKFLSNAIAECKVLNLYTAAN